ncbi:MAG TPA: M23 family metallopeptidase [Gemmatimonadaceae bacterium]|nr:M23 family metallopeptidase [Gemmatimonadaceae bacterium]
MTVRAARLATYAVAGLLAWFAIVFTPPLPAARSLTELSVENASPDGEPSPAIREHVDTLGRGETLIAVLARGGVSEIVAHEALRTARMLDPRRLPAGMPIIVRGPETDSLPTEIVFDLAIDRRVTMRRTDEGWIGEDVQLPWTLDTVVASGTIRTHLSAAVDDGSADLLPRSARAELTWELADVLEYRVDMSRDLREGDAFRVLFERATAPNGAVKIRRILATTFTLSGDTLEAIRYEGEGTRGSFFDGEGRSLRASFLRAPLQFRRISSVYGRRRHPILGTWRDHRGVDYAANAGTPVRTVGDGTVIYAGWRGGYGNTVEVRHPNGFVTRYGHLRGFARGVSRGARVAIGSTIGYVGATGLATGPHLHFEVLVNGGQRDPRVTLQQKSGEPIPAGQREAFQRERARLLAVLGEPDGRVRFASAQ